MRSLNIHTEIRGYKIQERIGIGGMGEVYKAFHPGLNRVAAVKFLFQKEHAERFKNEAYIQSSVNHPNIAKLYEYVVDADTPCIIMEYVEGISLDSYIYKHGRINSPEAEKILIQIVSALKYLHGKNILHRDVKPQNFKIENDGTVKMLDFGISKNEYTPKLTQLGFVVGTTEYMAPEQFEHKVEKKSDIWSLGVMAYEMLTGSLPFESNNPIALRNQIAKAKFTDPKILVPQISEKLIDLIDRSLKTNPSNRASAQEIEELLIGKEAVKKIEPEKKIQAEKKINLPALNPKSINITIQRKWIYAGISFIAIVVVIILFSYGSGSSKSSISRKDTIIPVGVSDIQDQNNVNSGFTKVRIAVNNVENAVIILPDSTRKSVPADLTGKPGESYNVILRADGFDDKLIPVTFVQTSKTYTYSLDKKTEE
ncbi:MAG: serine/threonine-protein kinase [Chitinophagales bacterium]